MKTQTFALFQQPKNTLPKIIEIFAFVSVDAVDGNEGVCAAPFGPTLMPLIAADRVRMEQLQPLAQQIADAYDMKIKLVRFSVREEIKTFTPNQPPQ
jgi:hypothetical protein